MQVGDAGGDDLAAHVGDERLADLAHGHVVVLDGLQLLHPAVGDLAVHVVRAPHEAVVGGDGHDAGHDGHVDALGAHLGDPAQEVLDVVEHLGDDEGATHVDLLLEVLQQQVFVLVVVAALGVAGDADVEVVAVLVSDVAHQVSGVLEASFGSHPLLLLTGRVSAQSQDVGAAGLVGLLQGVVDLLLAHVGAREMHARLEAEVRLGLDDHLGGQLGDASAGAPGDVDELGAEMVHTLDTVVEVLHTLCGLGREVLEREGRFAGPLGLGQHLSDVHVGGGASVAVRRGRERLRCYGNQRVSIWQRKARSLGP